LSLLSLLNLGFDLFNCPVRKGKFANDLGYCCVVGFWEEKDSFDGNTFNINVMLHHLKGAFGVDYISKHLYLLERHWIIGASHNQVLSIILCSFTD
jgi:hypothetical protein